MVEWRLHLKKIELTNQEENIYKLKIGHGKTERHFIVNCNKKKVKK